MNNRGIMKKKDIKFFINVLEELMDNRNIEIKLLMNDFRILAGKEEYLDDVKRIKKDLKDTERSLDQLSRYHSRMIEKLLTD